MAADLQKLQPALRSKTQELIQRCLTQGCAMRPQAGLRDPFDQAQLWRQSRSIEETNQRIGAFEGVRRLKGLRRIFSRFDKLDRMFVGFISFALIADGLRLY